MIEREWLETNKLTMFTADLYKGYAGNMIYGIECWFHKGENIPGQTLLEEDEKKTVDGVFGTLHNKHNYDPPSFRLCIGDWDELRHNEYTPDVEETFEHIYADENGNEEEEKKD